MRQMIRDLKHELGKNVSMPGMGGSCVSPATSMSMPQGMGMEIEMDVSALQASAPSIDIQVRTSSCVICYNKITKKN